MRLSPKDLLQVRFRKVLWGYDPEEVEGFMELIREGLEELLKENEQLRVELASALEHLKRIREEEELLREALLLAQKLKDEVKSQAEKEAQLLIGDAELRAQKIIAEGLERAQEIRSAIGKLRELRQEAIGELRRLVERIQYILSGYEEEARKPEEIEVLLLSPPPQEGGRAPRS
jgi:cell division initiation protein